MFWRLERTATYHQRFTALAGCFVSATDLLAQVTHQPATARTVLDASHRIKQESERLTHEIVEHVDRRLVTPFASDELHTLAVQLDQATRQVSEVAHHVAMAPRAVPSVVLGDLPAVVAMMQTLAGTVHHSIDALETPKIVPSAANDLAARAEHGVDDIETALAHLLTSECNPMDILWWKDVYDRLARAIKQGNAIAQAVRALAQKQHDV